MKYLADTMAGGYNISRNSQRIKLFQEFHGEYRYFKKCSAGSNTSINARRTRLFQDMYGGYKHLK
jgi:hypothetical protein